MDQHEKDVEAALEQWRLGHASLDEVRALARNIGAYFFRPGIPSALELMDHEDEIVRYNAASSLGSNFIYRPATAKLQTMLARDPDEDCRSVAASCLASLCSDTRDRGVLATLAKAALEDGDEDVRTSAYQALLFVNGVPEEQHQAIFQNPPHVDPERIKAILAETSA